MKLHPGVLEAIAGSFLEKLTAITVPFSPTMLFFYSRAHYTEYLCSLVFKNNVDPVSLLDLGELKQVFARANHFMPKQRPGEYEFQYKKRLAQVSLHF